MLTINYYGQLTEITGRSEQSLETESGRTVGEMIAQLENQHPELDSIAITAAVNDEMATPDQRISAGDHIDLFPPFAGG